MTYCLGLLLQDGLVMIADTRTNAGVDSISTFKKLHVFSTPGERVLTIASAGNLSVTQTMLAILQEGLVSPETGEVETLLKTPTLFRTAQLVARALKKAHDDLSPGLTHAGVPAGVTLLFGGQIRGGPPSLYQIYDPGNFIECGPDAPFLQVGETKYGKPILDRGLVYDLTLAEGLKLALISMESTMRSNLAVGPPVDVLVLRRDRLRSEIERRIEADDPYFRGLTETWTAAMQAARQSIPSPPYGVEDALAP
jgi:putative proteasome-type protease